MLDDSASHWSSSDESVWRTDPQPLVTRVVSRSMSTPHDAPASSSSGTDDLDLLVVIEDFAIGGVASLYAAILVRDGRRTAMPQCWRGPDQP
ncbi:hypothetical protein K9U39_20400 [Rhodoblastus acidophilus]|nr:hypothetical protein [Rhodoblastus acidophilus]